MENEVPYNHYRGIKVLILGDHKESQISFINCLFEEDLPPQMFDIPAVDKTTRIPIQLHDNDFFLRLWFGTLRTKYTKLVETGILMKPQFFAGAFVCLFLYDVTDRGTFNRLSDYYQLVKENNHHPVYYVFIGNKYALKNKKREISEEEALLYISNLKTTNENMIFREIVTTECTEVFEIQNIIIKYLETLDQSINV